MMISLVTPLLAVLIGAVTIGETLPRQTFVGGMMIIGSIALIVFRRGIFRSKRPNDAEDLIEAT
jgi:drug/metabolite transporter (DMT)-like permease